MKIGKIDQIIFFKVFCGAENFSPQQEITIRYLDTVLQVKGIISLLTGISVENQRIVFAGKELVDHRILSEYGIQKESTIIIIQRSPPQPNVVVS